CDVATCVRGRRAGGRLTGHVLPCRRKRGRLTGDIAPCRRKRRRLTGHISPRHRGRTVAAGLPRIAVLVVQFDPADSLPGGNAVGRDNHELSVSHQDQPSAPAGVSTPAGYRSASTPLIRVSGFATWKPTRNTTRSTLPSCCAEL